MPEPRDVLLLCFLVSSGACFDPEPVEQSSTDTDSDPSSGDGSTGMTLEPSSGDPTSTTTAAPTSDSESTIGDGTASTGDPQDDESSSSEAGPEPACGDGVPVATEICFDDAAVLESSDVAYTPRLGDTNGDSNLDVVYTNSDTLVLRLGDGAGAFGPELQEDELVITQSELGDIDGDGTLDIVGINEYGNELSARLGTGAAGFGALAIGATELGPAAITLGDLNGDGRSDAVVLHAAGESLRSYVANASGALTADAYVGTGLGTNPGREVALGDFTGDGLLDAAFTVEGDPVKISIGDGLGDFGVAIEVGAATSDAWAIAAGDFDQDGDDDLAIGDGSELVVAFGTGAAAFSNAMTLDMGASIRAVESVDVSNDGAPDLIVSYLDVPTISVLPNLGDGTFGPPVDVATGTPCESLATGDANADGVPDIILGCDFIFVRVLLSTP